MAAHAHAPQGPVALPGIQHIIAIGSGKGGVGKSTVAANLAIALAKMGARVGLIDADIYGPNIPLMFGAAGTPKVLSENRIEPNEAHGVKLMSVGLISPGDKPLVMRGPMLHGIVKQFLQQVEWGELDFLLIDLPPGTGDIVISLVQTVPLTGAIVVSTPSDVALQDARKALEMFGQVNVEILGIVENMSHFVCPNCHHEFEIFSRGGASRMAQQFQVPLLGTIELAPSIRESGDSGAPIATQGKNAAFSDSFYTLAQAVIERVSQLEGRGEDVLEIS